MPYKDLLTADTGDGTRLMQSDKGAGGSDAACNEIQRQNIWYIKAGGDVLQYPMQGFLPYSFFGLLMIQVIISGKQLTVNNTKSVENKRSNERDLSDRAGSLVPCPLLLLFPNGFIFHAEWVISSEIKIKEKYPSHRQDSQNLFLISRKCSLKQTFKF